MTRSGMGTVLVILAVVLGTAIAVPMVAEAAPRSCLRIVTAVFDAPGDDHAVSRLDRGYVVVGNACSTAVSTAGWSISDYGHSNIYTFPSTHSIAARSHVTIRSGRGTDTDDVLYWAAVAGVWNDGPGERAYLHDPAGAVVSIRAQRSAVTTTKACDGTLQRLVDRAAPGATVVVPACIYRELVSISKPLRLIARAGAEIRGSDIWDGWARRGTHWVRGKVPRFPANGRCRAGSERCLWPEQVFLDGRPLRQVAESPARGQFAVNDLREIVLADDPTGRVIEVTTRTGWLRVTGNDVTVEGFRMRHAATNAQHGAVETSAATDGFLLTGNVLSDAHGALVSLQGGTGNRVIGNELFRGGQLGLHLGGSRGSGASVLDNVIFGNNTEGFDPGWEAGGVKATGQTGLTIARNEVWGNGGSGLWCDGGCDRSVIQANRVHHNEHAGIHYEISRGGRIEGNWLWENGHGYTAWVGGAGILCNACSDTSVVDNVVAWNADGIGVQSQDRGVRWHVVGVTVVENVILMVDRPGDVHTFALGWVQDYRGSLYDPAAGNFGRGNRYWYPTPEGTTARFEWRSTPESSLTNFNTTPGENGGAYLTDSEKTAILRAAGMPRAPER